MNDFIIAATAANITVIACLPLLYLYARRIMYTLGSTRIDAQHVIAVTTKDTTAAYSSKRATVTVYLDSGAVIRQDVAGLDLAEGIAETLMPPHSDTKSWQTDSNGHLQ
jgi:hypothetical protein